MVANIFGKIYAKLGKLEAQNKVSRITRQIARMTKEIGRAEKQMNQMKRAEINQVKQSYSIFSQSNIARNLAASPDFAKIFTNGSLDYTKCQEMKPIYDQYQQALQSQTMMAQNDMQTALNYIEEKYEQYQETEIQAMKDEQADLEVEKETAQAEVQVYEGMEKQEGEFAKNNIQNMFQA